MSEDIDDLRVGERVQLEMGEEGVIRRIDQDEGVVYVAVVVQGEISYIDVDPSEPWFKVIDD